jgi:site-specific DNA-methyltransferase (adenine-specific)/adenine-specific DNA-methyltransferase
MPVLEWIGKQAVVNHHNEVPYRVLRCDEDLSVGDPGSGNLLVEGDNLHALKALLPYYAGQVKCIYIDPPYNTGNEQWVYNDNVNAPEIRKWLHQTVGSEAEDLSRHDKWLCMMYPRLVLLREFLRQDGVIFISIDDNEVAHLRALVDEVFGPRNFLGTVVWQKRTSPDARLKLGAAHDYILAYASDLDCATPSLNLLPLSESRLSDYKNPDDDPRGPWASRDITGQTGHAVESQFYEITTPAGKTYPPPDGRCWAISEDSFGKLVHDNRIWFGKSGSSRPRLKLFLAEREGVPAWTWWPNDEVGHNQEATKELAQVVGAADSFDNPKPTRLIKRILQLAAGETALIMDSFAGSGTTGHAVLKLNHEDGGDRRFILIELDEGIATAVTRERLARAVNGYTYSKPKGGEVEVEGLGGGFRYCRLGAPLFDETGQINGEVTFEDLARHVFFTETGEPVAGDVKADTPLVGVCNGVAVYLLYNGVLKDKRVNGGNVLISSTLSALPAHDGPKVVYGVGCRLGEARLKREGVTFRQIPYEVRVG